MSYRVPYPDQQFDDYVLSADKSKLDLNYLFNLLCVPSRYSSGLPLERFPLVIEHSFCFSVFHEGKQIGFGRAVADFSEFTSIWDVFIDDAHRAKGIGKALVSYIMAHPSLRGTFRWFLMTEDAHGLYTRYGFRSEPYNPYVMMKVNTDFV